MMYLTYFLSFLFRKYLSEETGNMKITSFELTRDAKKEIDNKLEELLELCRIHRVPMFASIVTGNSEEGTVYNNITYNSPSHGIELKDDQIRKHILVSNGFDVVPHRETITIDPNDFLTEDDEE